MNLFNWIKSEIAGCLGKILPGADAGRITVEPPRDPSHGDVATNAAMVFAREAGMAPRALAEALAPHLREIGGVEAVDIAGPGFLNLRFSSGFWQQRVGDILKEGAQYGASDLGGGEAVNVEYVSANPTGPMHVGHVRGAVYGDALANLLEKAGYKVCREYYINDAGGQVYTLARSAHLRYCEALGEKIGEIPEGLYPGDYLVPVGEAIAAAHGDKWKSAPESEWLEPIRDIAVAAMMGMIRDDLAALGIAHEVFFSERSLHESGRIGEMIAELKAKDLVYTGVLDAPKGELPDEWEPREQLLFRATAFGDDIDRPLQKSDGSYTYFAADIAYHHDKLKRGFRHQIDILGADHGGYVKRMKAAVKALSDGKADLDIRLCQLVKLLRDGQEVKMSKRAGTFVTLRDVVEEVGKDVTRFIMLTRKNEMGLDFDFAKVMEQSKDNPVFYVQYAHARVHSVLRRAPSSDISGADLSLLSAGPELTLIKRMAEWPRLVETAAEAHEPHRVAFYLYDLASEFHTLWNKGNDDTSLRFIVEADPTLTKARLAMITALAAVIASGLGVLGVKPLEEMQ